MFGFQACHVETVIGHTYVITRYSFDSIQTKINAVRL